MLKRFVLGFFIMSNEICNGKVYYDSKINKLLEKFNEQELALNTTDDEKEFYRIKDELSCTCHDLHAVIGKKFLNIT